MPFEVVGLVHDKKIEAGGPRLFGPERVSGEEFGGAENELAVQEWVFGLFVGVKGGTTLFVEEGEVIKVDTRTGKYMERVRS